ncbi:MAG TPA: M56 family metallopeptidase [Terriglobales bacterium]|nr:M56 family metallopeptidase [Terriglobales bacterium]
MTLYLLRAIMVSLAQFAIVYLGTRLLVAAYWSIQSRRMPSRLSSLSPSTLYALQLAPFVAATCVVTVLTLPAFLAFEPMHADEGLGAPLFIFSSVTIALLGVGTIRAIRSLWRSSTLIREWQRNAVAHRHCEGLPVISTGPNSPPLVVAGLLRPQLFVSARAAQVLTAEELRLAIAHESEHVRRRDNIKKLLLRLCSIPSSTIERTWLASVEVAADTSAVRSEREAIDLASAIVKASKLTIPTPDLAMNFAADPSEVLHNRIERLLSWRIPAADKPRRAMEARLGLLITALASFAVLYPSLLAGIHEFTEFLVR